MNAHLLWNRSFILALVSLCGSIGRRYAIGREAGEENAEEYAVMSHVTTASSGSGGAMRAAFNIKYAVTLPAFR